MARPMIRELSLVLPVVLLGLPGVESSVGAGEKLQGPKSITLASGARRQVLDVRMYAQGELESEIPTLFVDYLTEIPLRDRCTLQVEVREVWQHFKSQADQHGAERVFIVPNDAPVGGGVTSFALRRQGRNPWTEGGGFLECSKKTQPPSRKE